MMRNANGIMNSENEALQAVENRLLRDPEYLEAIKEARGDGSCIGYGRYAGRCRNKVEEHNLYCPRCNAARWAANKKNEKNAVNSRPIIRNMPSAHLSEETAGTEGME